MADIPITPLAATARYIGIDSFQLFTADRVVTWSASGGAIVSPGVGLSTSVLFPNKSQDIVVDAVSGADSGSALLTAVATFPVQPHYGYEISLDNKTLASYAEDGTAVFRKKGSTKRIWKLQFLNVTAADWTLLREFWLWHEKHVKFYYEDVAVPELVGGVETSTLRLVTFDAGLNVSVAGPYRYNITTVVREA